MCCPLGWVLPTLPAFHVASVAIMKAALVMVKAVESYFTLAPCVTHACTPLRTEVMMRLSKEELDELYHEAVVTCCISIGVAAVGMLVLWATHHFG